MAEVVETFDRTLFVAQCLVNLLLRLSHGSVVHHTEVEGDAERRDKQAFTVLLLGDPLEKIQGETVVRPDEFALRFGEYDVLAGNQVLRRNRIIYLA